MRHRPDGPYHWIYTEATEQWQGGGSDCALFALAFAADLCTGGDPAAEVTIRQRCMIILCLLSHAQENHSFSTNVHLYSKAAAKACMEFVPTFCVCRLPDDGSAMIQS